MLPSLPRLFILILHTSLAIATLFHHSACAADEPLPPKAQELLKDTHRVVFLGDSITQAGNYVTDVECWLLRHGVKVEVINLGLGSETGTDLTPEENAGHLKKYGFGHPFVSERLGRILEQSKPDLLFVCYGMNDCGGLPGNESGTARYGEAITCIRDAALKSGVKRVVLCTPPVHDDTTLPSDPADQSLSRYTAWLLEKKKAGWEIVDIHTPMSDALKNARVKDPGFLYAEDHVHPDREGHWLMARQIIEQALGGSVPGSDYCSEQLFPCLGAEIRDLVSQRQKLLFGAWMTKIGHKRPKVPGGPDSTPGPTVEEADAKAKVLGDQIEKKLQRLQSSPATVGTASSGH
jgi:lysophospholipase L1-like esterase